MAVDIAICTERLGKRYRLGERRPEFHTLRDVLAGAFRRRSSGRQVREELWALRDASFEVARGEVLGVIGANGAGKSTLLKLLSRITRPTEGRAALNGRVGSLLEVGTGFHPELTGRENIYLNGTILGMRKAEIERKLDRMVAFAEVERFLDTPVKHYSSGMYVRLAFAVAAHLETEILLVDEVLAVGDAQFQRKCLGVMGDVARQGRTVLFVSHNIPTVSHLCSRCLLLQDGRIVEDGPPNEVIDAYLSCSSAGRSQDAVGMFDLRSRTNSYPPHALIIRQMRLLGSTGAPRDLFRMGEAMTVEIDVDGLNAWSDGWLGVLFRSHLGVLVAGINTGMNPPTGPGERGDHETFRLRLPVLPFAPGAFTISLSATRGLRHRIDYVDVAGRFSVAAADVYGSGYPMTSDSGPVYLDGDWEVNRR